MLEPSSENMKRDASYRLPVLCHTGGKSKSTTHFNIRQNLAGSLSVQKILIVLSIIMKMKEGTLNRLNLRILSQG